MPVAPRALFRLRRCGLAVGVTALCLMLPARAAPAPFEDTMAQRTLACTACHGAQGRAAPDGYYPRIAGKPAGYLYNQLLNFRNGHRTYQLMTQMVEPLSDSYLREIAEYFAALELPYPAHSSVPVSVQELQRGEQLVRHGDTALRIPACEQCHGVALTGMQPSIPGLLGLPRDYLKSQLGAWSSGQRHAHAPDCMATIAQRLSAADAGAVTGWLASRPLPAVTKPAARLTAPLPLECGSAFDASSAAPAGGNRP